MAGQLNHILHLTDRSLRWATVKLEHRRFELVASGVVEGDAPGTLDEWARSQRGIEGEVTLYDGRPMYFSFLTPLPVKAKKQRDNVVRLRVRQELGLGEESVYWAARPAQRRSGSKQIDLFTVVVRKEALEDVLQWQKRYELDTLWVGADITAIEALVDRGIIPSPSVVMNSDEQGATIYYVNGAATIGKERIERAGGQLADMGWGEETPRMRFGHPNAAPLLKAHPELGRLPEGPALDFGGEGRQTERLAPIVSEIAHFDAVVLGGIAELGASAPIVESLLPSDRKTPTVMSGLGDQLRLRWLAPTAAAAFFFFLLAVVSSWAMNRSNRQQLVDLAEAKRPEIARLEAQRAVLGKIEADKQIYRTMSVIAAIHEAAPRGVQLDSLSVKKNGDVTIKASARNNENASAAFLNAATKLDMFDGESVSMGKVTVTDDTPTSDERRRNIKPKKYSFQISARLRGRESKKSRR